jgi:hypothetical protein
MSGNTRARLACQGGQAMPNTASMRRQSSREFAGRRAAAAKSAELVGRTAGASPGRERSSKMRRANSHQVVAPPPHR